VTVAITETVWSGPALATGGVLAGSRRALSHALQSDRLCMAVNINRVLARHIHAHIDEVARL